MGANGMVESYKSLVTVLYCPGRYYLHSFTNAVKGGEGEGKLALEQNFSASRKGKKGTPLLGGRKQNSAWEDRSSTRMRKRILFM